MSESKNTVSPRQWALLAVAAVVLVALCAIVGFSLFGQGDEQPSNTANVATASQTANASAENDGDAEAEADAEENADEESDADEEAESNDADEPSREGQTPSEPNIDPVPEPEQTPVAATITVSIVIDGTNCGGGYSSREVTLNEGSTVFDALKATGAAIGGNSSYVRSINGLAEFQGGPNSGWLYYVNGVTPNFSCGSYVLSGGESIMWLYVNDWRNYR